MKTRIIIDSTSDLNENIKDRFTIVPLTISFGENEYIDGITIDHQRFYEMLIESDTLPTTSQATPEAFSNAFQEVVKNGDKAVVITIASKLSGTYQSACIAAADYKDSIFVIDSKSAAIGSGILAELALTLAEEGMEAEDIYNRIMEERDNVRVIAMLDTLEYLKKGGRISKTVAFAGGLLNLKPVACIEDGEIKLLGKARGSKQGNNLLVQEINASGGVNFSKPLLLGYTGLSDILLKKYINDSSYLWEDNIDHLNTTIIGSVVGTHTGHSAVAVAFFKNHS